MLRYPLISFGIYAVLSMCVAVWAYYDAFESSLSSDRTAGQVRLSEASSRLRGQLGVYRALANITAKTPKMALALAPTMKAKVETDLSLLSLTYGAWDIDLTDPDGLVVASSSPRHAAYVYSQNLVSAAINGRLGYAIEIEGGQRLIRFSRGVVRQDSKTIGTTIVSANLAALEFEWPVTPEPLVFFNDEGLSISANRPGLLLLTNLGNSESANFPLQGPRKVAGTTLWTFAPPERVISEVQTLSADIPQLQMTAQIILDTSEARASALLRTGLALALMAAIGLMGAIFVQQRRRLALEARHSATLEQRVEERTGELKAAQDELVEASNLAALGRLSAGLSHELNQPLAAILNFAENGRRLLDRARTSDAAENLSQIADQTRRITRIIRNLRAFARQEHRPSERIDLVEVTKKALEIMQSEIMSAGVTLNSDIPDRSIFVMAGNVRLEQVVLNLVSNAIDAMLNSDQKTLSIMLKELDGQAMISMQDTGSGIKDPERVFEPFYTTKELGSSKGLGMGLALSFGLVSSFGGQLSCRNLSQGAEFTMTLPILPERQ
ncbi:MAG: ATP-binding protein [Rhizobiaceae bacterium]